MKKVKWMSPDGYKHCSLIREEDPDESASTIGIPCDPPDINSIDWEAVKRELFNLLVDRGLREMADLNRGGLEMLRSAPQAVLYKRLVALYQSTPVKEE